MLRTWRDWHLLRTGVLWYVEIFVIVVSICANCYVLHLYESIDVLYLII